MASSLNSPVTIEYEYERHIEWRRDKREARDTTQLACRCQGCRTRNMLNTLYFVTADTAHFDVVRR